MSTRNPSCSTGVRQESLGGDSPANPRKNCRPSEAKKGAAKKADAKPPRLLKDASREPYGRRALLAAATELFAVGGYEGASLHDICALAGMNIALVKYHFGSKEGLYEAVLEAVFEERLSGFLDIAKDVRDAESWRAAVREWFVRIIDITGSPDSPRNVAARIGAREFASPSPLHRKVMRRFYQPLRDAFAKLVQMAVSVEDGTPPDELQTRLWNSALGAVSFSHAVASSSWAELYAPKGVSHREWAAAEVDWLCRLVFSQLKYRG